MGLWIRQNLGEGLTVMSLKPMTAFYARGEHVYIPWAEYPAMIDYARRKAVDVIAIDEKAFREKRPILQNLLNEEEYAWDLSPCFISEKGEKIIMYQLKKHEQNL